MRRAYPLGYSLSDMTTTAQQHDALPLHQTMVSTAAALPIYSTAPNATQKLPEYVIPYPLSTATNSLFSKPAQNTIVPLPRENICNSVT